MGLSALQYQTTSKRNWKLLRYYVFSKLYLVQKERAMKKCYNMLECRALIDEKNQEETVEVPGPYCQRNGLKEIKLCRKNNLKEGKTVVQHNIQIV